MERLSQDWSPGIPAPECVLGRNRTLTLDQSIKGLEVGGRGSKRSGYLQNKLTTVKNKKHRMQSISLLHRWASDDFRHLPSLHLHTGHTPE